MIYDLAIIGGSAAGASASVYAARRGLKFAVITKDLGGEVALSGDVENWLGIKKTTGIDLSLQFSEHMKAYSPDIKEGYGVTSIAKDTAGIFSITTEQPETIQAKSVIIASGVHSRELGIPGEKEFRLKGVSYCTVCDGPLFKGKRTVTIGGGNSALESALMMADIASEVTVINKNPAFKGEKILLDNLLKKPNVKIVYNAITTEIYGEGVAKGLKYKDESGNIVDVPMEGAFVHIGQIPNSQMTPSECEKDQFGYIKVSLDGSTTCPGLFGAGDVTNIPHKQIIIAAGQGATAALSAVQYINRL